MRATEPGRIWRRYGMACLLALLASAGRADWLGQHYALSLRPDFARQTLEGEAQIELTQQSPAQAQNSVQLRSPRLDITAARLAGQVLRLRRLDGPEDGWQIDLPAHAAKQSQLSLSIRYRAQAGEGLMFGPEHVYTAFHSCQWLPCAGTDLSRASIQISLELPEGYDSLASGRRMPSLGHAQRWQQDLPYPLYTLGFAAGRFSRVQMDSGVTGQPELAFLGVSDDTETLRAKFAPSAAMLAFFSEKAGIALPQPVYSQLLLPGGAAQEASSYALIGRRMLDPILETPQEDWVIAHEMAHQWWGNLLSCAEWRDFWLNEGITTFMTAAWKRHRWGEAAYQRELGLMHRGMQRARDAGFDRPLSWPGDYPSLSLKRAIHYSKGALFMVALLEHMGEQEFWAGLRHYTQVHAGRSVRAADFQQAMQAQSRRDLAPLFQHWVYENAAGSAPQGKVER
ncbi:aminopeptidase [Paucibacter aquatile]|uniref:Aminopeptidase N n=2 Tax=Kinneretia aquatilis TaxID=2070761 RepID=A0A2N8KUK6_9BURK|nr:aminopeptidase [Paucibacter aquatile]